MKAVLFFLLLAVFSFGQEFKLGSAVSDFQFNDLSGKPQTFAALKGDVTVVLFVGTKCPISNDYIERMNALYKNYTPKGVRFLFLNSNQNEPVAEIVQHSKEYAVQYPVYKDPNSTAAEKFGAMNTPETFVIDKSGLVRYHGYIDDSRNPARISKQGLRMAIDALLAGKPVPASETKAFGCTIKRPRRVS